jgi:transposase InsO family protein
VDRRITPDVSSDAPVRRSDPPDQVKNGLSRLRQDRPARIKQDAFPQQDRRPIQLQKAYDDIARWIELRYNRTRLHSALGYRTPQEVMDEYLDGQAAA